MAFSADKRVFARTKRVTWSFCLYLSIVISVIASVSTNLNSFDVFQIPDQQAFLGKLFYYQINIPSNVKNLTLTQAGYSANTKSDDSRLPDWLYFDANSGLLFGAPYEKKIYFIQVQAILDHPTTQIYDDIFVIEVLDIPAYLQNNKNSWDSISKSQTDADHCQIELKENFANVKQLFSTVVEDLYKSFFSTDDQSLNTEEKLKHWLQQFNVAAIHHGQEFHLTYQVEKCQSSVDNANQRHYLDSNSEILLAKLNKLGIKYELFKISALDDLSRGESLFGQKTDDNFLDTLPQSDQPSEVLDDNEAAHHHHLHHHHHHKHNHNAFHRKRNVYADGIYSTPTLKKDWISLTTSTIDLNQMNHNEFVLSRTVIPSMVSPTFSNTENSDIVPTPTLPSHQEATKDLKPYGHQPLYPKLYSTPVLLPDISSLLTKSIEQIHIEQLATPVFSQIVPSVVPTRPSESSSETVSSISVIPEEDKQTTQTSTGEESKVDSVAVPTTPATFIDSITTTNRPAIIPNRRPFVNKRISKISITAGKYWQSKIPEETFMDIEDGNTKQLKLGFYLDSQMLPLDYWIQFDHENQFLFALPTEDNIGKYRFNLVAVDSQGADVTEVLEIYVRQPRQSLTYTHKFVMANISWVSFQFVERIKAVSIFLQRMATQVFEEVPSSTLDDAAQRQAILRSISVLSIEQNKSSGLWSITWTNDTLRRHPCPVTDINKLFTKLYDITYPEDNEGFMTPSIELNNALTPEFSIKKVKRLFIGRSACGSYATIGTDPTNSRHKEKIVFSNRLNRLGPYKLGEAFKFVIPKDTVYSVTRQVDTRDLALSLSPVEPEVDLPDFIFFDAHEKTIYGLPYKAEHVRTYELKLIAEDTVTGDRERDLFVIDIAHDLNTREDYLFEVTMSFMIHNIELTSRSQQRLTPKDYYQVAQLIAMKLMGNSNLEALRMLDISRNRFTKLSEPIVGSLSSSNNIVGEFEGDALNSIQDHLSLQHPQHKIKRSKSLRRRSHRDIRFKRALNLNGDYFYEFVWTNRSLVTSYLHSSNAFGGGTVFETETCPKDIIHNDIYNRLFPQSTQEFMSNIKIGKNSSHIDIMEAYSLLFETIEANIGFLCVEWTPKSVCSQNPGLEARVLGAKPIRDLLDNDEDDENNEHADNSLDGDKSSAQPESVTDESGGVITVEDNDIDQLFTQEYVSDKMLAMIIPPIAILTALLFAVCIGCCFHRANRRRKAMGNLQTVHEESPSLYRNRIPIQFEFEVTRGGGGAHPGEQESMLDTKLGRQHPIQIMPSQGRHKGPHPNLAYHMLPQQR